MHSYVTIVILSAKFRSIYKMIPLQYLRNKAWLVSIYKSIQNIWFYDIVYVGKDQLLTLVHVNCIFYLLQVMQHIFTHIIRQSRIRKCVLCTSNFISQCVLYNCDVLFMNAMKKFFLSLFMCTLHQAFIRPMMRVN